MHHSPLVSVGFFCERAALADGESVLEERVQDQEYASQTFLIFSRFLGMFFACETSGRLWVGVSQVKLKFHGYSRAVEHRSHFARLTMAAQIVAMLCLLM